MVFCFGFVFVFGRGEWLLLIVNFLKLLVVLCEMLMVMILFMVFIGCCGLVFR